MRGKIISLRMTSSFEAGIRPGFFIFASLYDALVNLSAASVSSFCVEQEKHSCFSYFK
jgi:hypothetical protein